MRSKIIFILLLSLFLQAKAQDTLKLKGQFSNWLLYSSNNELPYWFGSRYIPQLNYTNILKNEQQIDFEASINTFGTFATNFNDSTYSNAQLKPYRVWARYSGKQFELRAGLQKINFGSATMLRPLMWFDQVDARDPLKLTDGVWGILGRYYFMNNSNIWLWALYKNKAPRGWEFIEHNKKLPEFGTRVQFPLKNSEIGFSYHHNLLDSRSLNGLFIPLEKIPENKFGFDLKIDWFIGIWLETTLSSKSENLGIYTHQKLLTIGSDYTFKIGNGLNFVLEHLLANNTEKAYQLKNILNLSAISASYPISLFDNLGVMFYYDWNNNALYNFMNWQRQFNKLSLHVLAFWNPKDSIMPTQTIGNNLFSGKGIQLMLLLNH